MKAEKLKITAMVMAVAMLITCVPAQWIGTVKASEAEASIYIIREIEEYRDKFSKTYLKSDGTYTRLSMAQAIHAWDEENKRWNDIDNTLTQKNGAYTNAESDLGVSLPVSLTPESAVKISSEKHQISMRLGAAHNALGRAYNGKIKKKLDSRKLKKSEIPEIVETLGGEGALRYANVLEDTDITYTVTGDKLKENIVLNKKPHKNTEYKYNVTANNLTAVLNEDKSVSFYDAQGYKKAPQKIEALFTIPAPNMYDASGEISYEIGVTLQEENGEYILTYAPDYSWLASEERVYPVTIDPTVMVTTYITDCYTDGTSVIDTPNHHYVGKGGGYYLIKANNNRRHGENDRRA